MTKTATKQGWKVTFFSLDSTPAGSRPLRHCLLATALLSVMIASPIRSDSHPFTISPITDAVLGGTGLSLVATGLILRQLAETPSEIPEVSPLLELDSPTQFQYYQEFDLLSDLFEYASFALPALLSLDRKAEGLIPLGLMFTESTLIAIGLKDILKGVVRRYRPYMHSQDPPKEFINDSDRYFSFPSGHTTMAFTGATLMSVLFATWYPDSEFTALVIAGSFALATATAVFRVASGQHFVTDVLAGALIGSLTGLVVPLIHIQIDT